MHISKKAETSAKIKEEISINNCLVSKLIFNETNPSYRFVLPNEKYDDAYNENSDNIVYFGDITFEINREGIFNKLYEMAIGEYTSIYQNQDLYMQEYIAYLENLLNKYTLIYNNMQIEKLNQSEQKLTLSKD